ncbi:glycoside hydrolase family 88/105 protein [Gorillibacterium sp. sgz5001074]|uniref:glycoside hydrolase family 88/105 protein n=1 Tax=Gorillibacterium sp. sgz5001074 TaxID=3446695 RepID=UPI003F66928D
MGYFESNDSVYSKCRTDVKAVLETIAGRYIGDNPAHPFVNRLFSKNGFTRLHDYRYEMDLTRKWEHMPNGRFVYVWGKLWSDQETELNLGASCFSPVKVWVNGDKVFASNISDEMAPARKNPFRAAVRKGWNDFILQFEKTANGCGGIFGTASYKNFPLHFVMPTPEREGLEGWMYSEPTEVEYAQLAAEALSERNGLVAWYPETGWDEASLTKGVLSRIFGEDPGRTAFAWTTLSSRSSGRGTVRLEGEHRGSVTLILDGAVLHTAHGSGSLSVEAEVGFGEHELIVRSVSPGSGGDWGFTLRPAGGEEFALTAPVPVRGLKDCWLYLGTFGEGKEPAVAELHKLNRVHDNGRGGTYWRADLPDTWVRPYLENTLFGKWNYPLGVTLYGLMETGASIGRRDYVDYVLRHVDQSASYDEYSLWDGKQYGAAGVNNQLALIDSLDDCGSFGATMLAAMAYGDVDGGRKVAARIAEYISRIQDRRPDGALYRVRGSVDFMQDTLWCDDLYMSVPFLCRYTGLTGDPAYLDDAANQMLLYKKYLYMPEQQIMSHIYDFKTDRQTEVAWGRGNGWVLFSLAELLTVLPIGHGLREELLVFFRELCEGYLRLQGAGGLWHQVLTDPSSYEETSCTSMFLYAFARGIRNGWLEAPASYVQAVIRGWEGMTRTSIDKYGNIYGVCRGSGYSFSGRYYRDDLSWLLNDTHGIGIVMLAGVEVLRLSAYLKGEQTDV